MLRASDATSFTECGNGVLKVQVEFQLEGRMLKRRGAAFGVWRVKLETPSDPVSRGKDLGSKPATQWVCLPVLAARDSLGLEVLVPRGEHTFPRGNGKGPISLPVTATVQVVWSPHMTGTSR